MASHTAGAGPPFEPQEGDRYLNLATGLEWTRRNNQWAPVIPTTPDPPDDPDPVPAPQDLTVLLTDSMTKPHEGTLDGVPDNYDWSHNPRRGVENRPSGAGFVNGWGQAYTSGGNLPANVHVEIRNMKTALLIGGRWQIVQTATPDGDRRPEGAYFLSNFAGNESKGGTTIVDGVFRGTPHRTGDGKIWNMHFWCAGRAQIPAGTLEDCCTWYEARLAKTDPNGPDNRGQAKILCGAGGDWYGTATNFPPMGDYGIGHHAYLTSDWAVRLVHTRGGLILTNPPPVTLPGGATPDPEPEPVPPAGDWHMPTGRPVRIMPTGDSITEMQAQADNGWTTIGAKLGFAVEIVGPQTNGFGGLHHAGFGGWCLNNDNNACKHPNFQGQGINDHIVEWLNAYNPDIVVLNAGANDAFTGRGAMADDYLSTTLDRIHATKPGCMVLVTQPKSSQDIPANHDPDLGFSVQQQMVVVAQKRAAGYNVRAFDAYAGMTGGLNSADWPNYVHPGPSGIGKMINNTAAAILALRT